ncbi:acetoacetate decarboxylase family protein [Actinocorallia aurea]
MHEIQGRQIAMPVEIRKARVASAMWAVPARTAQSVIGYSGLRVLRPGPGLAVCTLAFIEYEDGDLGPYHEFAVAFLVEGKGEGASPVGAFIHWLPVDGEFTLAAGRGIWGFPKVLTHLPIDWSNPQRAAVHEKGALAVALQVKPGLPVPSSAGTTTVDAYSCIDGVTRRTPWVMTPSGVRMRPGGAAVVLGPHPAAEDLRRLGLDRLPALTTTTVSHLRMTFEDAVPVS